MENYDLVIVGGGPAGLAAAISARKMEYSQSSFLSVMTDSEES